MRKFRANTRNNPSCSPEKLRVNEDSNTESVNICRGAWHTQNLLYIMQPYVSLSSHMTNGSLSFKTSVILKTHFDGFASNENKNQILALPWNSSRLPHADTFALTITLLSEIRPPSPRSRRSAYFRVLLRWNHDTRDSPDPLAFRVPPLRPSPSVPVPHLLPSPPSLTRPEPPDVFNEPIPASLPLGRNLPEAGLLRGSLQHPQQSTSAWHRHSVNTCWKTVWLGFWAWRGEQLLHGVRDSFLNYVQFSFIMRNMKIHH